MRARVVALLIFIVEVCFLYLLLYTILGNSPLEDGVPTHVLVRQYGAVSVTLGFSFLVITLLTTIGTAVWLELYRSGDVPSFPLPILALTSMLQAWGIFVAVHSKNNDYFFVPAQPLAVVLLATMATMVVLQLLRLRRTARSPRAAG